MNLSRTLGGGHREHFDQLIAKWDVNSKSGFEFLRRCEFRTIPQVEIETTIGTLSDFYFTNTSEVVFAQLREFLETRLNKKITTESGRSDIRAEKKLGLKDWSLDPTLREQLIAETKAYLDSCSPFGVGGEAIPRRETGNIIDLISNPHGPTVIIVSGIAGSGKSGVVRGVIEQLKLLDIPCLALRIDHHLDCTSNVALGKAVTGREESPATTIKGVEPDNTSVLIVDQVDAVSEISGRNGAVKEAVLRLVDDARNYRTVRLVLVCRSFDLDSDARLKTLKDTFGVVSVDIPLLSWSENVEPLLTSMGSGTRGLDDKQQRLLCLPLNLAIFFEVGGAADPSFATRNDLFEKLLVFKERKIRRSATISWNVIAPLSTLASWMSDRQKLSAPKDVLSQYNACADILTSEGLIIQSRDYVGFFHESFFDYIYARTFSAHDQSLEDLLTSSVQHLFRRTQARQILETLRQSNFDRYLIELKGVVVSDAIRFHIKVAVAQWLGTIIDPSVDERDVILAADDNEENFPLLLRYALLASAGWFDRLNSDGWVEAVLNGNRPKRRDAVFWWLSDIAHERPAAIVNLLERWWSNDPERGDRLVNWFGFLPRQKPDRLLAGFCERVIRSNPPGLFDRAAQNHDRLLLATWAGQHSDGILDAYLEVWFEAHPGQHPFQRDAISGMDAAVMEEMAKKSPRAFVDSTVGAFSRAIEIILDSGDAHQQYYHFKRRVFSGYRSGEDVFLGQFRSALVKVTKEEPEQAKRILASLDPNKHEVFTHLHLETISANGAAFFTNFVSLLRNPHIFKAGWDGADWKSFADAAKAALPYLNAQDTGQVEDLILRYQPEIDIAQKFAADLKNNTTHDSRINRGVVMGYLNRSGLTQLAILEAIGRDMLSAKAQKRVRELRNKFPNFQIPSPSHHEAGFVRSPINREHSERMNDEQWLMAMAHYDDSGLSQRLCFLKGGAHELANELQNLTKHEPVRFAKLVGKIPDNVNRTYIGMILWGLAEAGEIPPDVLKQAVTNAHNRKEHPYGREIARIFQKHPSIASDEPTLNILLWYLEHGQALNDELAERDSVQRAVVTIEDLLEAGGKLHIRGSESVRGLAAEALGSVIWEIPNIGDIAWSSIERRIEKEQLLSVRCCLVHPLIPLFNQDRERCARLISAIEPQSGSDSITPEKQSFSGGGVMVCLSTQVGA